MNDLKNHDLYNKVVKNFSQGGFEENIQTTQGFVLGLICAGYKASDSDSLTIAEDILNCGNPLSGTGVAVFTTLMIELENQIQKNDLELFIKNINESDSKSKFEALQNLVNISYGFTLGYSCNAKTSKKKKNKSIENALYLIQTATEVDIYDTDFDGALFDLYIDAIKFNILKLYLFLK